MRKSTLPQWGIRVLFYCIALFFMALGVAFSANSDLGISPVNSLPYVISDIVKETRNLRYDRILLLYSCADPAAEKGV